MQSEPYPTYKRKGFVTRAMDTTFLKVNTAIEKFAVAMSLNLSNWTKGQIKRKKRVQRRGQGPKPRRNRECYFNPRIRHKNIQKSKQSEININQDEITASQQEFEQDQAPRPHSIYFGTQEFQIGIDNRCTASMSNNPSDFVGKLTPVKVNLKSYDQEKAVKMMKGTLKWTWSDESGKLHTFRIPNSYYDPNGSRLLSPQHWSQELKKSGKYKKVYYTGDDQSITLYRDENYRSCEYKSQRVADLTAMSQEINENKSV